MCAAGVEREEKGLSRLFRDLDEKSRAILGYLWWNRHAQISELRGITGAPQDYDVLHRLNEVINKKSEALLGKPVVAFERSKTDPLTGEKVLFSWWFLEDAELRLQEVEMMDKDDKGSRERADRESRGPEKGSNAEETSRGMTAEALSELGGIIPGLRGLIKGLEKSEAFAERLKATDEEIERRLREGRSLGTTGSGPNSAPQRRARDVAVDIFDEGDDMLRVVAELPGADEDDIHVGLGGATLTISAGTPTASYYKKVDLGCRVTGIEKRLYNNGILQLILMREEGH